MLNLIPLCKRFNDFLETPTNKNQDPRNEIRIFISIFVCSTWNMLFRCHLKKQNYLRKFANIMHHCSKIIANFGAQKFFPSPKSFVRLFKLKKFCYAFLLFCFDQIFLWERIFRVWRNYNRIYWILIPQIKCDLTTKQILQFSIRTILKIIERQKLSGKSTLLKP